MHRRIHLLIISVLLLLLACPALADAEYSITNYSMLAEVQPDGSAEITETLAYDFDGEYNGILSLFDTDGIDGIEDFTVTIDGAVMTLVDEMTYIENTYTVTEVSDDLFEVRVYSPGKNNRRLVTYEYTMEGLARRYADTGMIHRKLIGENSSVTLHNATVVLVFPGNEPVKAFVHGAMDTSHIKQDEGFLTIGPENVRPGSSVEVRLLFPEEWLSASTVINEPMYKQAIDEEARRTEEDLLRAERTENAKYILTAAYLIVFFALWSLMAKKYGLKGRLHETPDPNRVLNYPAAFLTAALEDEADTDALTGTLMELVADGSILMEPEGEGLIFKRVIADTSGLYPHQAALIDWLFDERDSFLLSDLNAGTDYERAQQFETGYNRYVSAVSKDMLSAGLRFKNDGQRITLNALIILLGAMGTGGVLLAGKPNILLGVLLGASLFVLISLMSRVRRLTDEGERLRADTEAFREAGVAGASVMNGAVSCYAALGMTEPLIGAMETFSSDAPSDDMPVWMYTGWYYSLHQLNSSMRDTHHHNASIPNPNASSSSSSASGGGGGGHGAW